MNKNSLNGSTSNVPVRTNTDVTVANEPSPLLKAAQDELGGAFIAGKLLRFVKGDWLLGEDKKLLGPNVRFVALMNEYYRGYCRWQNGAVVEHRIGRASDGFVMPARGELGHLDQSLWETDRSGKKIDPWTRVAYLGLLNPETHEHMVFATTSDGGRKAVAWLVVAYEQQRRGHPGQMPIVKRGTEDYQHGEFGRILKPVFTIDGWADVGPTGNAQPTNDQPANDNDNGSDEAEPLDDAIPF